MTKLAAGIPAFILVAMFAMPLKAQETPTPPPTVEETAEAVAQEAGEALAQDTAAVSAMDEAEVQADEAAAMDDDAGYGADDSEWLWILGLAGAFIIVWFLLRRKKARRAEG
jgi:hypothetical protein